MYRNDDLQSSRGEIARTLVEFLEVAITSILFVKGVYPSEAFERRRYMNVVVQRARHPELRDYIHSAASGLLPFIQKDLVERVAVIFFTKDNIPVERFIFKLTINPSSEADTVQLEFALRSFLVKLSVSKPLVKSLPRDCRWEVTAYLRSLPEVGSSKDAEIWIPTDIKQWQQPPLITPIKSLNSEPLCLQLYLEHPSLSEQQPSLFLKTNMFRGSEELVQFGKWGWKFVQVRQKSGGGRRPKKKVYHRVHELDKVMDLQKKPNLIIELKSIIQMQKHGSLLLRDLEKHVGFVRKWNFMAVIDKYASIFYVGGGNREPPFVTLTAKAKKIADEEAKARELMEPILVRNLRKLLMMSVDCRVPLEKIDFMQSELGLPQDFKDTLIPKFPEVFSLKDINGRVYLVLENWDSSLAVTAREEKLSLEGIFDSFGNRKRIRITKDGNFLGHSAFKISFPVGFRPNASYLEEFEKWQRMEFPSPYLNARRFEAADPKARKRVVAVLHELLSLTMEKRLTSAQIEAFHSEYMLPSRLILCLIKHQGIFYLTNKGARSTVFLKEAYAGSKLIKKCPLLSFYDRFVALSGGRDVNPRNEMQSSIS